MTEIAQGPKWSDFIITDAGLRLRTQVIAEKGTIDFIYAEVGEGKPPNWQDVSDMSDLINYKGRAPVVKSFVDENDNHIMIIKIDNKDFNQEILVTEVAVYAQKVGSDEVVLYGYSYCLVGAAPMPPGISQRRAWNLIFDTKISRTSDVTIVYDGSGAFVPYDEYDAHMPNHAITTIPIAPYNPIWELYEIHDGITAPLENWAWINGSLKSIPFEIKVDYNTKETTIYSTMQYANRQWEIHKAGDNAYRLISGDIALKITWR